MDVETRLVEPATSDALAFLFTDIEGSTRLWEQFPATMPAALARHDAILRTAIEAAGGTTAMDSGQQRIGRLVEQAVEIAVQDGAEDWIVRGGPLEEGHARSDLHRVD